MPFSPIALLIAAAAVAVWSSVARPRPEARRRSLERVAGRVGLPVPESLRDDLEERVLARNLAADRGFAVGLVLAGVYGLTFGDAVAAGEFWILVAAAIAFGGVAVGVGVVALRESIRPRGRGPRVARATTPALGDYVAPVELWGARVVSVLPLVLLLAALGVSAVTAMGVGNVGVAVGTVLAPVVLAAAEVGGRRLLDAPQAAGSDLELAWSDAMRARVLRDVATVPIAVGTYVTIGVLRSLRLETLDPPDLLGKAVAGLFALVLVAGAVVFAWSLSSRPHRHFRRRLWPEMDAAAAGSGGRR